MSLNDKKTENEVSPTVSQDGLDAPAPALPKGTLDPVYEAKANVLNEAVQSIGMGRYQWLLFVIVGFGWASDNLWPIVTSLILPPITLEFKVDRPPLLTLSQNIGLLVGAMFWGFGCDVFGRKWGFNLTLLFTAVFGLISAGSPTFAAVCVFDAFWSFGVGGNLPVDSAIFLEFLPGSHQYLLVILSVFWALAQLLATLVAWPLLGYHTCEKKAATCTRSDNFGWRWFVLTMGILWMILFAARFAFRLHESPKYLMSRGKDAKAVEIVHEIARRNKRTTDITVEDLTRLDEKGTQGTSAKAALKRRLEKVNLTHVRALFATPKLAWSTSLIMIIWGFIGLAFPLYNAFLPYLQQVRGADFGDGSTYITYRNSTIIAVLGVPGAIAGGLLVQTPKVGRKGALAIFTTLTGIFLFASTTAKTSDALLGWNCAFSFCTNVMYAVLYAYTPEIFPTKDRGTGNALTATANRVFGIMAPIIAIYADLNTVAPVYVSGALFITAGLLVTLLPFEPLGKASL